MPRPPDRPPTTDDLGVKMDVRSARSRIQGLGIALSLDRPGFNIWPDDVGQIGQLLALDGAAAPVAIDISAPDWREQIHRTWSQGGNPCPGLATRATTDDPDRTSKST